MSNEKSPPLPKIKFDRLWEKLATSFNGDIFTTIRRWTEQKGDYYNCMRGNDFEIVITGTRDGFKELNNRESYIVLLFKKKRPRVATLLEVFHKEGYDLSEAFKQYDTKE